MIGKGAGIPPFFEESVVKVDPLLNLRKVSPPPHLTKEISFEKLEGLALLKIGARLDCPNPKGEIRKPPTISTGDSE
jgi:hypothetical protein